MEKQIAALATDEAHMVMWDIDSVIEDWQEASSVKVPTARLVPREWLTIDREYAKGTDVTKPIIVFELPDKKAYIADGNHRVYKAATEHIPEVNVILIPEKQHLRYLFRCGERDYIEVIRGLQYSGVFIDNPLK